MGRIDWDLWGVNKEQRKVFGCGYASNPMDKQPEIINSKVYQKWSAIMFRCKSVLRENHTNIDFSICKEWLDFSKFKEFYEKNCYELENEDVNLYATLLDFSNTEYSPEKAVFAPKTIGSLLNDSSKYSEESKRYNLPKWVRANIKDGGRNTGFGGQITFCFKDEKKKTVFVNSKLKPYDVFLLCKFYKELSFVHSAYQYKDVIEERLFDTIIKYRATEDGEYYIDSMVSPIYLYGIGYIRFENFSEVTVDEIKSDIFKAWEKIIYAVFKGEAEVCEEWKDYFMFKKWWLSNEYNNISAEHKIFNIIYDKCNTLFSPQTTSLLPNNLYILVYTPSKTYMFESDKSVPYGITKKYMKTKEIYQIIPPRIAEINGKYYVKASASKRYNTLEEAQIEYKNFRQKYKEKYLKEKGYENLIDPKLYQALMNYEIDIPTVDNWKDEDGEEDYIEC